MRAAMFAAPAILLLLIAGCALRRDLVGPPVVISGDGAGGAVEMPRAWPTVVEALVAAHRQTGLRYTVVPARFEGVIGPFEPGERVPVAKLIGAIAHASGTRAHTIGDVMVFDVDRAAEVAPAEDARQQVHALSLSGASATIPELCKFVDHDDASLRLHALAALSGMEGDFMRQSWPGRVSIFEVMRDRLDRQALLWALTEGTRQGSPAWQMALSVLARAREPYLCRHLWHPVWMFRPGAVRLGVWGMGRGGDPTANWSLRKRLRNPFTNDPADRYLAAAALGELGDERTLLGHIDTPNVELRRAVVFGLSLCPETESLLAQLDRSLGDSDPAVRFLACQALGRIGSAKAIARLQAIASDTKASPELRCAALDGLGLATSDVAFQAILDAGSDTDPILRAKAADLLGEAGGARGQQRLLSLIGDDDRWVRASAALGLGRLGSAAAVERVVEYIADDSTDRDGLIAALIGLGRGRSPLAEGPLSKIALDVERDRRLRRYAVLALAQLAGRAGRATLKALTEYGTPDYLPFALRHLELATPGETAQYVSQFLAKGFRDTQAAAACRLAELAHGDGVRELLEGYDVFDNHARMMHMWGPIRARGPEVVPALVAATSSKRAAIRESAALALGGRVDVAAVDALLRLARDSASRVRSAAAQSLGICGDPKAIPVLIELAEDDENKRVACAAIRALRLRALSRDPDVQELFARLVGTPRDCGVIDPDRPSIGEQPAHSFVLRRWAGAHDDPSMCNISYETSLAYDSGRGRVVLWGAHGRRADAPQTGQTWFYDARGNSWKRLVASREWPNATCCVRGTTYDPANQVVVSPLSGRGAHGWVNALRVNMQYSLPWVLDARTDQWYPAKPTKHKGYLNMLPGSFDPRHGVVAWWYGKVSAYDAYSNEWSSMSPGGAGPGNLGNAGAQFDPKTGRLIVVASRSTWAYDPAADTWTDLKPNGGNGPTRSPMVYDSANDVMLAFQPRDDEGLRVWVYHIRENRWEALPSIYPAPHYHQLDVAYDSRNNVAVISGGWQTGRSGEVTVRETWTYRHKPAPEKPEPPLGRPRALRVTTLPGGKAKLAWKAPARGKATAYRLYRGVGARAWKVEWQRVAEVRPNQLEHTDQGLDPGKLAFYRAMAVDAAGKEGPASYPCRTAPPAPRWATAAVAADGIRLKWEASSAAGVVGYHVYRAPVSLGSAWGERFDPSSLEGKFTRLTAQPVKATDFVDQGAAVSGPASELHWPDTFAYIVRAVNAWGQEGGQSPTTLALPDPPGRVLVIPWLDGRRLVLWSPCRTDGVRGYHLMRMDDWNRHYVFRWHASPLVGCGFYDGFDFPTADRRRYYVSGVDILGGVGIPSSGAWSHGLP